ncbi:MAG: hypothetical protein HYW79_00835 [Parcubacteria group bacterium]|nr:hypothetical protein [Parcubacteria group bacterium]
MTKTKIIVICIILILSVIAGLLIKISLKEPQSKSEQAFAPPKSSVKLSELPSLSEKLVTSKEAAFKPLNIPVLPIPRPDLETISKEKSLSSTTMVFFENINKAAKNVEKSLMPNNIPSQNNATITSDGIILSLTKEQFDFLYPDYFIADLIDAQNSFVKEQDSSYEPILKIETDSQVRFIEEKIVATLLIADMITRERAEQLVTTIRFTLPRLQITGLQNQYSYESMPFSKFFETALERKTELPETAPKRQLWTGFIGQMANSFTNKAQAACGECESRPECYQDYPDTPGKEGSSLIYPSCYCTGCLTSLGCLSANEGDAAIYDQQTGICGIGQGQQ